MSGGAGRAIGEGHASRARRYDETGASSEPADCGTALRAGADPLRAVLGLFCGKVEIGGKQIVTESDGEKKQS